VCALQTLHLEPGTLTLLLVKTTDTWQGGDGPNTMDEPAAFALRTLDLHPPTFTLRRPLVQRAYNTAIRADFALSEPGEVSFIVLPSDLQVQPSSDAVVAGSIRPEYQADVAAAGALDVLRADAAVVANITGLQGLTDYDLWAIGRDVYGNQMPLPVRLSFSTLDNEPPEVQQLVVNAVQTHSVNFTLTLDEPGRAYYAVSQISPGANCEQCPSAPALKASAQLTLEVADASLALIRCAAFSRNA
jgi:hypothetical protein